MPIPWRIFIFIACVMLRITTAPVQGSYLPNGLVVRAEGLDKNCAWITIHVFGDRDGMMYTHTLVETPTAGNGYSATVKLDFIGNPGYIVHLELFQFRSDGSLIYGESRVIPGWWWTGETPPSPYDPPPFGNSIIPVEVEYAD